MNKNKAILKELSLGSESAFEDLYKLYFKSSFDLALYITKSKYLSEETVSDVFALIWKNRSKLSDIKDWEAYLYIMVRNKAFYYRKKKQARKTESFEDLSYFVDIDNSETPLDDLQHKELNNQVRRVLNALPERMKLIFYLVKEKGVSHKELAKQFNLSERTINAHITEATRRLRDSILHFLAEK